MLARRTTQREVARILAPALGVRTETLIEIDAKHVVAGIRQRAGHGRAAELSTPALAAKLLVAALASPIVKEATATVGRFEASRPHVETSTAGLFCGSMIPQLRALPGCHSFIDAMTAMITAAAAGALDELADRPEAIRIHVINYHVGEITLVGPTRGASAVVHYPAARPDGVVHGDMQTVRSISASTILAIGNAFRGVAAQAA
jgi:hypothetical protein